MKIILNSSRLRHVARAIIFLIVVALVAGMAGCDGYTPPSKNLEIRDWYDLDAVRNNLDGNYILMNDLDSTTADYEELASPTANEGKGWEPIGFLNPWNGMDGFRGTFDGQGHEIRNLFINHSPFGFDVGLFGVVDPGGIVQNIGVVNADVTGFRSVGGLVGTNGGTVSNSYSTGSVTCAGNVCLEVGGLVGTGSVIVSDSFWDIETSGQTISDGGTGKTTAEMKDIATFSGAAWDIIAVAPDSTNTTYIWNIINGVTYPFLSWQP